MKITKGCKVLLTVALVFALTCVGAWAQSTGSITGKVKDASGAILPGVEVSITNTGTGDVRGVVTGEAGTFRVTNLIPGKYQVKATLEGFKTAQSQVIALTVGEIGHVELTLQVGAPSEVVTVTDAQAVVNVEQGRVSSLVDEQRVKDLPLNGRDVFQLMQLAPGAVNATATTFEPSGSGFALSTQSTSVNGGRANFNGFWLDGLSSKGLSGGTNAQPSVDAIQEFRIETLNFSAEYGDSSGSVVSVVTKSGGNQFHGSLYEFHRNDNLDAREFFDADDPPAFIQNQYGVSVGGPIVKDKTFFFGSWEGVRVRTGEAGLALFESRAWSDYASSYGSPVARFLYSTYGAPRALDSVTSSVGEYLSDFGYTDDASQASVDAFLGSAFGSPAGAIAATAPAYGETSFFVPNPVDGDNFSIRIDQEFGGNDKVYGRYFFADQKGVAIGFREAFNSPQTQRSHQFALNWTHILSPTTVNEARVGLNRAINDIIAGDPGVPYIADGGSGTSNFGAYNGYPQIFHENVFNYADTLSISKGNHGLKMGAELRRNQENSEFNVGRPSYYFYDLVYLALDDPYYLAGGVDPTLGTGACVTQGCATGGQLASNFRGWRNWEFGLFVNDDWKIKDNLTINLGLRWDYYTRLTEVQNRATAFNLGGQGGLPGDPFFAGIRNGEFVGPVDSLSAADYNNFAPRLGLAWDPFGDGKMSVRLGYGVAYQSGVYNPLANSRWNKPFYSFNVIWPNAGLGTAVLYGPQDGSAVTPTGPNNNPGASLFEGNIIAYDENQPNFAFLSGIPNPNQRDPYVQSYFVGIQRELFRDTTFEVNYVGTLGRKIIRAENPNRFPGDQLGLPSPTGEFAGDTSLNRVNPNEGTLRFWENSVNSNYHALQVQLNRRYSSGFAINANYTWSKSLDTRSTWHSGATSSNLGQEGYSTDISAVFLDYGRSIFDARQRFVVSWLWDMPFLKSSDNWALRNIIGGWQLNGIMSFQTGQPFTPFCSLSFGQSCDWNADGNSNDRPNAPSFGNSLSSSNHDFVNPNSGIFNIAGSTLNDRLGVFTAPTLGANGTLGRNTFEGPGFSNVDFSVFKDLAVGALGEQGKIQLRFEFFNLFNRPNFFQPEPRVNRSQFGRSTAAFDAREIQLGVKVIF